MKKLSKILIIGLILSILLSFFNVSKATTWDTALNMVKEAMNTKYFNGDKGYVTHKITSIDSKAGEVKLRMTLTNLAEEAQKDETVTEIYIVLSETLVTNPTLYEGYCSYIETLAKKVFDKNSNAKIGIIGMRGPISELADEDGDGVATIGPGDQGGVDGTENDSEVVIKATNNIALLKDALADMNKEKKNYYVNLQSALITAEQAFEENSNKILISLFDDVPSTSVGTHDTIRYRTEEDARLAVIERYSQLVENTKNEILNLKSQKIDFILLRPDDRSFDRPWYDYATGNLIINFDGSEYVKSLYGTLDVPTYGKMYSLATTSLEKIVTDYIYSDIIATIGDKMSGVQIFKYFTKEIIDNFSMSIDNVDGDVDTSNISPDRYWIWNVKDLEPQEIAVLNYTLKIKDMKNRDLLDLIVSVDEKIDIKYIDDSGERKTETETTSPQVQLTGTIDDDDSNNNNNPQEPNDNNDNNKNNNNNDNNGEPKNDDTTAKTILPKTGSKILVTFFIGATIAFSTVSYVKYRKLDDVK